MSYSQNDEEAVILKLIGNATKRRFLDIGAHDGKTFSNTRCLAERGWSGTLVEPSVAVFPALERNYADRKDMTLVNVAVVPSGPERKVRFYDARGDCIGTLDEGHRRLWESRAGLRYDPIEVTALSVAELLRRYPGPYAMLNLDVEGTNFELFEVMPLVSMGVIIACIEYQNKLQEIVALAEKQGFVKVHTTGENVILRRRS